MLAKRVNDYDKDHCWQYEIRLRNRKRDLVGCGLTEEDVAKLKVSDFTFKSVEDEDEKQVLIRFIQEHEWLGTISQYTTHWFACYHKRILAGVILMNMPNAFSNMLGENTRDVERLISRGACISWSPKNLGSAFMMWSIKWMVKNTQYRLFTAYSDPVAMELGTIYQACNFYYLGQKAGAKIRYVNPYSHRIVSDRFFRARSAYKKYAIELGIEWQDDWSSVDGMNWKNIPDDVEKALRDMSKIKQAEAKSIEVPLKHKYAYVMGASKKETKRLRQQFIELNNVFPYPTERGYDRDNYKELGEVEGIVPENKSDGQLQMF